MFLDFHAFLQLQTQLRLAPRATIISKYILCKANNSCEEIQFRELRDTRNKDIFSTECCLLLNNSAVSDTHK